MKMNQCILNLDGKPFSSFEAAAKMRDLLSQENPSQHYQVELFDTEDSSRGFIVERKEQDEQAGTETAKEIETVSTSHSERQINPKSHEQPKASTQQEDGAIVDDKDTRSIAPSVYHPALRTYLLHIPLILAALWLLVFTEEVWITVLSELGLKSLPAWINGGALVSWTRLIVGIWTGWLILTILLNYYGTTLIVDRRGVTLRNGIVTRDETNVRFNEIRTIGLRQGVLDRLLGIGILEFASSGTDDVDIRFFNIANPAGVKAEIESIVRNQAAT